LKLKNNSKSNLFNSKKSTMEGIEYQLFLCQHPLYVIRKVHRSREFTSPGVLKATPITFYYILHGKII